MRESKVTVKIPRPLYRKVQQVVDGSGFNSPTDFIVKALTPIEDFNEQFHSALNDDEVDTIGGLVLRNLGHLPQRGETTDIDGFQFKVLNADKRQIHLLRVSPLPLLSSTD